MFVDIIDVGHYPDNWILQGRSADMGDKDKVKLKSLCYRRNAGDDWWISDNDGEA